jgi:DNA (cytosine-5)-methyltransferase 1
VWCIPSCQIAILESPLGLREIKASRTHQKRLSLEHFQQFAEGVLGYLLEVAHTLLLQILYHLSPSSKNMAKVLSLFSGFGGLDIGFHKAGFEITACVEIEDIFCKSLQLNTAHLGECTIHNMDVRDFVSKEELHPNDVEFIIGGPPCQPFSAGGRRVGGAPGHLDEIKGTLFEPYAELVEKLKPRGFLFENVKGILSSNKGEDWKKITAAFRSIGYALKYQVFDAAEYGVPQHRERVILIGIRADSNEFKWPVPTHGPHGTSDYVSAEAAFEGLDFYDDGTEVKGKYVQLLKEVPPGENYSFFTINKGHPDPQFAWRSRFSGFIHKADPSVPVKTLLANPGGWGGPFHWESRRMTIAELKRLQSIPDDWLIHGSRSQKIRQIGNSVPPMLAFYLAKAVSTHLFEGNADDIQFAKEITSDINNRKSRKATKTRGITLKPAQIQKEIVHAKKLRSKFNVQRNSETLCEFFYSIGFQSSSRFDFRWEQHPVDLFVQDEVMTLDFGLNSIGSNEMVTLNVSLASRLKIGEFAIRKLSLSAGGSVEHPVLKLWALVELIITRNSTYSNLQKFYGHFTEPHPQFDFEFIGLEQNTSLDSALQCQIGSNIGLNRDTVIDSMDDGLIKFAMLNGYEVRTWESNIQVKEGHFRITYPFPTMNALVTKVNHQYGEA